MQEVFFSGFHFDDKLEIYNKKEFNKSGDHHFILRESDSWIKYKSLKVYFSRGDTLMMAAVRVTTLAFLSLMLSIYETGSSDGKFRILQRVISS